MGGGGRGDGGGLLFELVLPLFFGDFEEKPKRETTLFRVGSPVFGGLDQRQKKATAFEGCPMLRPQQIRIPWV